jgi:D-alanyl-D-alanine dipeptidase
VAVDAELPARVVLQMRDTLSNVDLVLDTALPETRITKDTWEIQQLALPGDAIDQVHWRVPSLLSPGRTESEIAKQIEELMLAAGFTGIKFISVGSGENGAIPHHAHSGRALQNGDTVVVDLSGVIGSGYHADCTRTYALEPVPAEVQTAYSSLRQAFDNAMAEVWPGVMASTLDDAARSTLSDHGLGDLFIHRLGHGIGRDVHEPPSSSKEIRRRSQKAWHSVSSPGCTGTDVGECASRTSLP